MTYSNVWISIEAFVETSDLYRHRVFMCDEGILCLESQECVSDGTWNTEVKYDISVNEAPKLIEAIELVLATERANGGTDD